MKKVLSVLSCMILFVVGYSQQDPMSFHKIESCYGKTIYVTPQLKSSDRMSMAKSALYEKKPGKYKSVKIITGSYYGEFQDVKNLPHFFNDVFYRVYDEIDYDDVRYVRFGQSVEGDSVFFIVPKEALSCCILEGVILDLEEIRKEVNEIWEKYIYLDNYKMRSALTGYVYDRKDELGLTTLSFQDFNIHLDKHDFCKLNWANYKIRPDKANPYEIGASVGEKDFFIHYEKLHRLISNGALVSSDYVDSIRHALHVRDSLDDIKDRVPVLGTYLGDTIAIFAYNGKSYSGEYLGIFNGKEKTFEKYQSLKFANPDDAVFLQRRGLTGIEIRKEVAREYDSLSIVRRVRERERKDEEKRLEEERRQKSIDSTLKVCKQKQIFILSQEYAYGEYGKFGLEWLFYNCFNKPIKYIEITIKPYNQVNDVQGDEFGRKEAKARCIGPVEEGNPAKFTFDDLFWDEKDLIHYLRVSYIKITFMDNSTKVYSGWENIKKRMFTNN